jgi:hypothetical protein
MFKKMREKKEMLEAYRTTFNSYEGKMVLRDLMKSCSFYNSVYSADHATMAFDEGQRALVLRIIDTLKMTPQQVETMFDETLFEEE